MHATASGQLDTLLGHLNAPYGPLVRREQLAAALACGGLDAVVEPAAQAVLASIFVECAPHSIAAAAAEIGAGRDRLEALYRDCVGRGEPRSAEWERAMGDAGERGGQGA